MSRAIDCLRHAAAALACAALIPCGAQTLNDLAESQRAKQQIEIAKTKQDLALAEAAANPKPKDGDQLKLNPADAKAAAERAAAAARPKIVLHALYSHAGVWVAEIAQGQRLAIALIGMQLNGHRVTAIDGRGLVLSKPCTAQDVRLKARCGQRILTIGESV